MTGWQQFDENREVQMKHFERIQIGEVAYNAATRSFEALVTVHDGVTVRRYPCAIDGPITLSFEDASRGLSNQALRRHRSRSGLYSQMTKVKSAQRAGRPRFDLRSWLEQLLVFPGRHAA